MPPSFDLPHVDRLTVGTVGPPGQRTFYLQAREGEQVVTLKLEKAQVAALADRLGALLRENPATDPVPEASQLGLEEPVLAEWAVGTLGLSFDVEDELVVLVCEEIVVLNKDDDDEDDEDDEEDAESGAEVEDLFGTGPSRGGAVARFGATRAQVAALAIRGAQLVATGRPSCPLCGYPLDQRGHTCPKTNGHRPPLT